MSFRVHIKNCDDPAARLPIVELAARLSGASAQTVLTAWGKDSIYIYGEADYRKALETKRQLQALGAEVRLVDDDAEAPDEAGKPGIDNEATGRILSDEEYVRALTARSDIFFLEKGGRLRNIEAAALAIGILAGVWITTVPQKRIAPDFFQTIRNERKATLYHGQKLPEPPVDSLAQEMPAERTPLPAYVDRSDLGQTQKPTVSRSAPLKQRKTSANAKPESGTITMHDLVGSPVSARPPAAPLPAAIGVAGDTATQQFRTLLSEGNSLEKQGKHTDALAAFRSALRQDPRNSRALGGIGDVFLHIGFLDSAEYAYDSALSANPKNPIAHNGLGSVRYYNSDMAANPHWTDRMKISDPKRYIKAQFDSAIAEYTAAFSLDSSYVEALTNRGVLRDIHGQADSAIRDYSLAIRINPSYADAFCKRAAIYRSTGKLKEAIADYTAAIKLGPGSYIFDPPLHFANAFYGRGLVRHKAGDFTGAIADFDSCLAISPNHALALLNKGIAFADQLRLDSAIAGYTRAIALLSPLEYAGAQGLAFLHRGTAYKNLGKYDAAISDYAKAFEFPRLAARSCWRLAECYCLKHDTANAISWLNKAVSNGFSDFAAWERDKDLSELWKDKDFLEIVGKKQ
jgi:tetratricopeptide (TPR) repeat protein